jgi:hypothetical protein
MTQPRQHPGRTGSNDQVGDFLSDGVDDHAAYLADCSGAADGLGLGRGIAKYLP